MKRSSEAAAAGRATVAVRIEGIVKEFGRLRALDGVDLEIGKGEFFTLLGPSGCGKTTLLRCIAGFERPTGGRILFNGEDMTSVPPWEKSLGFVFQNYALWPHKSVFKNVAYGLELRKLGVEAIRDKVAWALELVGLPGIGDKLPEQLSGGQQQRVAIARALVVDPQVLLLDEPLSNLDTKLRVSLRAQIREIQRSLGITAVYVTHDQEEALEISDRIAVMNRGSVLQVGGPEDIYERPADQLRRRLRGQGEHDRRLGRGRRPRRARAHETLSVPLDEENRQRSTAGRFRL